MSDAPSRAPGELADEVEAMLKSMRPEDIAAGSGCQPVMDFSGPEWSAILAALRASQSDGAAAMREAAAAIALTDCRTPFAKRCDVHPEWDSYAIDIANAIMAIPLAQPKRFHDIATREETA